MFPRHSTGTSERSSSGLVRVIDQNLYRSRQVRELLNERRPVENIYLARSVTHANPQFGIRSSGSRACMTNDWILVRGVAA